jgi:hypothetical protein
VSIFSPIDPRYANDRRKRLAARLMQQGAALGHPALGMAKVFHGAIGAGRAPFANLTFDSFLPPGLANKLGPGGYGRPGAGQFSPGPGIAAVVQPPVPVIPPPAPNPSPIGGGHGTVPAPAPSGDFGGGHGSTTPPPPPAGGGDIINPPSGGDVNNVSSSNLIPLGGGVYFDPTTGQVFGGGGSATLGHGSVL